MVTPRWSCVGVHAALAGPAARWLWRSGLVGTESIDPLGGQEMHAVLDGLSGAPVHHGTRATLLAWCGGRPGFAVDAVADVRSQADARAGRWHHGGGDVAPGGAVVERAAQLSTLASPVVRHELARLAVAGGLPSDAVRPDLRPRLADLVVERDGWVRLDPPLLAPAWRATLPARRRRALATALLDEPVEWPPVDRARLMLEVGQVPAGAAADEAIDLAVEQGDIALARALTTQRPDADQPSARRREAIVLTESGQRAAAVGVYQALAVDPRSTAGLRAEAGATAAHMLLWDLGDGPGALAAIQRLRAEVAASGPQAVGPVDLEHANIDLYLGHVDAAAQRLRPIVDGETDPESWTAAASMLLVVEALTARSEHLDESARARLAAIAQHLGPTSVPGAVIRLSAALWREWLGDGGAGREALRVDHALAARRGPAVCSAWLALAAARTELAAGRSRAAAVWAEEARDTFGEIAHPSGVRWALSALLMARAGEGDRAAVVTARDALDAAAPIGPTFLAADERRARAWAHLALGEPGVARRQFTEAADLAAGAGLRALELSALTDAARAGFGHRARLDAVLRETHTPLDGAVRRATSRADLDAEILLDTARRLVAGGRDRWALDIVGRAASSARREGRRHLLADAAQLARQLAHDCGVDVPAWGRDHALTAREREVARLAGDGLSNRDIAERCHVSVRTVDNALHRVYVKLGVSGRGDLRHHALDG